jgi:hypothetical protein
METWQEFARANHRILHVETLHIAEIMQRQAMRMFMNDEAKTGGKRVSVYF